MTEPIVIRPQPGPQEAALASGADILIYGGAAGGGKTFGLLLDPLRFIGVPGYGAVVLRRQYPDITATGGMWDESFNLYPHAGGGPPRPPAESSDDHCALPGLVRSRSKCSPA